MTRSERYLIVNADDFGLAPGVNDGIIRAHEEGIVTSTSMMVRGDSVGEAAKLSRLHPRLSVGLHIDLGEWVCRNGEWEPLYLVCSWDDGAAAAAEMERQLDRFREIMGRDPTHIDSHQHCHRREPLRTPALDLARRLGVPLRQVWGNLTYCGSFHGADWQGEPELEGISVESLIRILHGLPDGYSELGCHPAAGLDTPSPYRAQREVELTTLCEASVKQTLGDERIQLRSYDGFPKAELKPAPANPYTPS